MSYTKEPKKDVNVFCVQLASCTISIDELLKMLPEQTKKALTLPDPNDSGKYVCKYQTIGDIASDTEKNIVSYIRQNKNKRNMKWKKRYTEDIKNIKECLNKVTHFSNDLYLT